MPAVEVQAKVTGGDLITVKYDFGDNLAGLIAKCSANGQDGETVVFSNARANIKIAIQDIIRAGIKAEKSVKDIQKEVDAYVPGVKKRGKSKSEKLSDEFASLSPEDKKALLAQLAGGAD